MLQVVTNKEVLLDTTMRIVAEVGLPDFSLKQVTRLAHTSDALIYRHFETRENLLLQCYLHVEGLIYDLFEKEKIPDIKSPGEFCEYIHKLWLKFFRFLIKNDYKTLYYSEYRESKSFPVIQNRIDGRIPACIRRLTEKFNAYQQDYSKNMGINTEYFWGYILDISIIYAKKVIRKEMEKNKGTYEMIWKLLWNGASFSLSGSEASKAI